MPEYLEPGVYVEETSFRAPSIEGVGTTTCAFVGPTREGPPPGVAPPLLTSSADFERSYGDAGDFAFAGGTTPHYLAHGVHAFFANGGRRLYVLRVPLAPDAAGQPRAPQAEDYAAALAGLDALGDVRTFAAPGASAWCTDAAALLRVLADHARRARTWRFAVLDPPPALDSDGVRALRESVDSAHAALYYPWVVTADQDATGAPRRLLQPPSGFICGIYARNDIQRGVHATPANQTVASALGFERPINAQQQERLNPFGVNCLRSFFGHGHRVWGARTVSSDPEWKYVNVRRYFDYLEASIDRGLQWVAFEANGPRLWANVAGVLQDFLYRQWQDGALSGNRPEAAYFVRCDASTMTPDDIAQGRVVCLVGVALLKPGEFTIFRASCASAATD